jgi:hypothetical protein
MKTLNYGLISIYIMTKTIFGKKLLLIATITVLVTGLMMSATFNDAEAKKEPKAPKAPSMKELKCKDNVGSFVSFGILGPGGSWGPFVSTGESKCKSLGDAAFTSVTRITGAAGISGAPNCIELVAGPGAGSLTPDGYGISKKGFFTYDLGTMEQCFFDASGGIPTTAGFCGLATDTHTSTVTGTFIITDGLIKGAPVTAGSGMLSSVVDHCAGGTAPNGDSVITTLTGTITY